MVEKLKHHDKDGANVEDLGELYIFEHNTFTEVIK